jgi:hypothetical protein
MALLVLSLNVASDGVIVVEYNLYENAKVFIHYQFSFLFTMMMRTRVLIYKRKKEKKGEWVPRQLFPFYTHFKFIPCDVVTASERGR